MRRTSTAANGGERGQVTAEYAVGLLGAVTIATVLFGPDAMVAVRIRELVSDLLEGSFSLALPDLFGWPW